MSNIAIQGAATGTGVFTLASPATNTNRTLTLPDEAGTVLVNGTTSNVGIGTSSPESFGGGHKTLELSGSTNTEGGVFKTATSGSAGSGSTGTEMLVFTDSVGGKINVTSAHPAVFYTANTERMRIDSAGRVTMPYQPAFRATSDDGSQSLTNNVNAVAIFDVAETNIGSHYNTLNGKFTAPISGFYGFSSSLLISQGGANRIDLMFYKNGSAWVAHEFKDYGAVSSNSSVTASMHGYLNSNDYVEVVVMIGGANGSIYSEPKFWNFSGYLVG